MRPVDLAREHGLSTQAVRNYEEAGALPGTERTASGHRVYTGRHAAALRAFLALVRAIGHRPALEIMTALHRGDLEAALTLLDRAHEQLLRDRATLAVLERAVEELDEDPHRHRARATRMLRIGELAGRLRISPATLRHWESLDLITPQREQGSGQRLYPPQEVHDAELVHLLRRSGHPLADITLVLGEVRGMGEDSSVHSALAVSRDRVTGRGLALLAASAELTAYLGVGTTTLER